MGNYDYVGYGKLAEWGHKLLSERQDRRREQEEIDVREALDAIKAAFGIDCGYSYSFCADGVRYFTQIPLLPKWVLRMKKAGDQYLFDVGTGRDCTWWRVVTLDDLAIIVAQSEREP